MIKWLSSGAMTGTKISILAALTYLVFIDTILGLFPPSLFRPFEAESCFVSFKVATEKNKDCELLRRKKHRMKHGTIWSR